MNTSLLLRSLGLALAVGFPAAAQVRIDVKPMPATVPATMPAAKPGVTITDEARALMDRISAAYLDLKSLEMSGTVSQDLDVAGQKRKEERQFAAAYQQPNKFRHELKDEVVMGSTGQKVYAYSQRDKQYVMSDAPEGKVDQDKLPYPIPNMLEMQNPSLLLAMLKDPSHWIRENNTQIVKGEDVNVNGTACVSLQMSGPTVPVVTLAVDPHSGLLRRMVVDLKKQFEKRGVPDVKAAAIIVEYAKVTPNAPLNDAQFAWTPPAGAVDASKEAADAAERGSPADALVGKPAPQFKLAGLDGAEYSLADQKGSVVVLDFWATWCGPCRQAMPHLNQLYKDRKADGLKVWAVNQRENKEKVSGFLKSNGLEMPALLDTDGAVADQYRVRGIPQTVVIGRDGQVKNVFVGFGPGSEDLIRAAVDSALKAD